MKTIVAFKAMALQNQKSQGKHIMYFTHFWSPISHRVTNTRWSNRFDQDYKRIPLGQLFGGYMPSKVVGQHMYASIGNRNRLMNRKTKIIECHDRRRNQQVFGGAVISLRR